MRDILNGFQNLIKSFLGPRAACPHYSLKFPTISFPGSVGSLPALSLSILTYFAIVSNSIPGSVGSLPAYSSKFPYCSPFRFQLREQKSIPFSACCAAKSEK